MELLEVFLFVLSLFSFCYCFLLYRVCKGFSAANAGQSGNLCKYRTFNFYGNTFRMAREKRFSARW